MKVGPYPYFEQIYPTELQLNKANSYDTEASFLDLSITNGIVSLKYMINGMIIILNLLIFHCLMDMFLVPLPMVYLFFNLFILREYVPMLVILTTESNF